jgi:heparan-alpha-glucosaminide N-acetyltransferase
MNYPSFVVMYYKNAIYVLNRGYLGPGGRHADGKYWNCPGGASGYVDKVLLGVNHIYQFSTANSVYESGPYDPEGILGLLYCIN